MIKLIDEQFFEKIKFWKIFKFVWEFQIFKFLKELVDSEHILEKVITSILTLFVLGKKFSNFQISG